MVFVANHDFAVKNPELVKAFLKAYQRGNEFIKANHREAAQLVSDEARVSPEQLVKVLTKFDFNSAVRGEDIQELKAGEEFMRSAGITKSRVDIDAFVDPSYLKAAGIQ